MGGVVVQASVVIGGSRTSRAGRYAAQRAVSRASYSSSSRVLCLSNLQRLSLAVWGGQLRHRAAQLLHREQQMQIHNAFVFSDICLSRTWANDNPKLADSVTLGRRAAATGGDAGQLGA